MGHIIDLVPNHMGIAKSANPWWQDVLENGESSRYADVFDIDWHPLKPELEHKVLLPVLGDVYGAVLERQEIRCTTSTARFHVTYFDHRFPIAPGTYDRMLGIRRRPRCSRRSATRARPASSSSASSPRSGIFPAGFRRRRNSGWSAIARRRSSSVGWRR